MSLADLLFSFKGRINRKPYWLTSLSVFAIMIIVIAFAIVFVGTMAELNRPAWAFIGATVLAGVVAIPLVWIGLAIGAKRLHDRNKSAWWLIVFYVVPTILDAIGGMAGSAEIAFTVAGFAVSIWGLVEMGFLRGNVGPNRYGPDPFAGHA